MQQWFRLFIPTPEVKQRLLLEFPLLSGSPSPIPHDSTDTLRI
jgi:hypothetical protein